MEIVVLGSSSAGNSMLLRADEGALLFDAGLSLKEVRRRLSAQGIGLEDLEGVLLTHEHADHARGVGRFLRTRGLRVASNGATARAVRDTFGADGVEALPEGGATKFGAFNVRALPVPHDSADCCAFAVEAEGRRVLYATDLGAVPESLLEEGRRADFAVIESNHDRGRLWSGSYPKFLKERIAGGRGHLSNDQAAEAVVRFAGGPLKKVLLAHLSVENNEPALAVKAVEDALRGRAGLSAYGVKVEAAPRDGPVAVALA